MFWFNLEEAEEVLADLKKIISYEAAFIDAPC
jgi:hypothetical protein